MSRTYPYYSIYELGNGKITRTNSYNLEECEESQKFVEGKAREMADKTGREHLILLFRGQYKSELVEVIWPGGLYKLKVNE